MSKETKSKTIEAFGSLFQAIGADALSAAEAGNNLRKKHAGFLKRGINKVATKIANATNPPNNTNTSSDNTQQID